MSTIRTRSMLPFRNRLVLLTLLVVVLCPLVRAEDPAVISDLMERGRNLFELGNLENAIVLFEEVDSLAPGTPSVRKLLLTAYRFLGIDYYGQSRCEEAIAVWRKGLALDPENRELPRYVERCESELGGMARLQGQDSVQQPAATMPRDTLAIQVDTITITVASEPEIRILTDTLYDTVVTTAYQPVTIGLAAGVVARTEAESHQPNTGWGIASHLDYLPERSRFGVRLDGLYMRLHREESQSVDSSEIGHLGVIGGSVGLLVQPHAALHIYAGPAVYAVDRIDRTAGDLGESSRSAIKAGAAVGIGWQKSFGKTAATINLHFLHVAGDISPDFAFLAVGLTTR